MADRYDIKGRLGRGGIGAIYRAHDTVMGREVAIKRLLPIEQTKLNESADESLKREAAALAKLSHPNILTIYAFEEDEEGPYVVTELIEGENLKETIERGALPLEDFEGVVAQTLEPLISAHAEGVLHRDIKPANIMLQWLSTGKFQIKILDFGLAKFSQQPSLQTLDQTGSFLGSIDYIAPEQIELQPLDFRTDLYSLGCVYYFALTQRPPFEGKTPAATMRNHLEHSVMPLDELRADLPIPIRDWLMRLIARPPADRPSSASEALREFEEACRGTSPLAALTPPGDATNTTSPVLVIPESEPESVTGPTGPITASGRTLLTGDTTAASPALVVPDTTPTPEPTAGPTGPITSSGKTLLTGDAATARQKTAPRGPSTRRTDRSAKTAPTTSSGTSKPSLRRPLIALIAVVVLAVIVIPIIQKKDSNDSATDDPSSSRPGGSQSTAAKSGATTRPSSGNGDLPRPKPAALATSMPHAAKAPRKLPTPKENLSALPTPPVSEGLVGHYDAAALTFREDLKSLAKTGDRVAAWGNLAGNRPFHYLARLEDQRDQIPNLVTANRQKFPTLNANHPLIHFTGDNGLRVPAEGKKSIGIDQQQLSFFVVLRAERANGHIIKFDGNNKRWNFMTAIAQKDRYLLSSRDGEGKGRITSSHDSPLQQFMVYSAGWDGTAKSQRLRITNANGERKVSEPTVVSAAPLDLFAYQVGTPNKSDTGPNTAHFTGYIAAILIYSRHLEDSEFNLIEDYLVDYFFE